MIKMHRVRNRRRNPYAPCKAGRMKIVQFLPHRRGETLRGRVNSRMEEEEKGELI